jgi:hypothetical protein
MAGQLFQGLYPDQEYGQVLTGNSVFNCLHDVMSLFRGISLLVMRQCV